MTLAGALGINSFVKRAGWREYIDLRRCATLSKVDILAHDWEAKPVTFETNASLIREVFREEGIIRRDDGIEEFIQNLYRRRIK